MSTFHQVDEVRVGMGYPTFGYMSTKKFGFGSDWEQIVQFPSLVGAECGIQICFIQKMIESIHICLYIFNVNFINFSSELMRLKQIRKKV